MLVYTNINDDFVRLVLKGYVIPTPGKLRTKIGPLGAGGNLIDFGELYKNLKRYETIPIFNDTADTIRIIPQNNFEFIKVSVKEPELLPETSTEIIIEFSTKDLNYGKILSLCNFDITVKGKTSVANVSVMANIVEDFSKLSDEEVANPPIIDPGFKKIDLNNIEPDKLTTRAFEIANKGKRELHVHRITTTNSMYDIEPESLIIQPEEKGVFNLSVKPTDKRNNLASKLTIISNDPSRSTLTYKITGKVFSKQENNESEIEDTGIDITISEALKLIEKFKDKNDFVILDVRTNNEFENGCLHHAVNLDSSDPDFESMLTLLDKNKTYLVYCQSGIRSRKTIELMKKNGFSNIYHMFQGIMGWKKLRLKLSDPNLQ